MFDWFSFKSHLWSTDDTNYNANIGGYLNHIGNGGHYNAIIGGYDNDINAVGAPGNNGYNFLAGGKRNDILTGAYRCSMIGAENNEIGAVSNSVILGGAYITATQNNTAYVPSLVINTTPATSTDASPTFLIRDERIKLNY